MRRREGFSLLELLIVVAIIAILMTMYLATFGKVRSKAVGVAAAEGMRQGKLGRMADDANGKQGPPKYPTREECRAAFREKIGDGLHQTRMLYRVSSDHEFEAYYFTLIDRAATDDLVYEHRRLVAKDRDGNRYLLTLMGAFNDDSSYVPVAWEYLSTFMGDMNGTGLGGDVLWGDGHIDYVKYQDEFPMTKQVAELCRRFVIESELD